MGNSCVIEPMTSCKSRNCFCGMICKRYCSHHCHRIFFCKFGRERSGFCNSQAQAILIHTAQQNDLRQRRWRAHVAGSAGSQGYWARSSLLGDLVSDPRNCDFHGGVQRHVKPQLPSDVIDNSRVQWQTTSINGGEQVSGAALWRRWSTLQHKTSQRRKKRIVHSDLGDLRPWIAARPLRGQSRGKPAHTVEFRQWGTRLLRRA